MPKKRDTPASGDDPQLAALKAEIAKLQKANQSLQNEVAILQAGTPPDDFAAAVQHALDKLQTQLSTMSNPVSNFAVREFRLEANVWISVTPLGIVEYRFVTPGENVDASALTKVTLDLVPLAKQGVADTYTPDEFQPALGVEAIEGLTTGQKKNLHAQGIDTIADFLAIATRSRSSIQLVSLLGVTRARFAVMLAAAQLLTLKGIDGGRATVMAAAGIDTLAKVAVLTADQLATKFNSERLALKRTDVTPLTLDEAAGLIYAAQAFVGLKTPSQSATTPSG